MIKGLKNIENKRTQVIVVISIICFFMLSPISHATSIEGSVFFKGFMQMLKDAGKALAIISPLLGGVMVAYCFVRRSAADEMDHKKWSNRMNVAIFSGIGGALGGVIMNVIGSYFGIK